MEERAERTWAQIFEENRRFLESLLRGGGVWMVRGGEETFRPLSIPIKPAWYPGAEESPAPPLGAAQEARAGVAIGGEELARVVQSLGRVADAFQGILPALQRFASSLEEGARVTEGEVKQRRARVQEAERERVEGAPAPTPRVEGVPAAPPGGIAAWLRLPAIAAVTGAAVEVARAFGELGVISLGGTFVPPELFQFQVVRPLGELLGTGLGALIGGLLGGWGGAAWGAGIGAGATGWFLRQMGARAGLEAELNRMRVMVELMGTGALGRGIEAVSPWMLLWRPGLEAELRQQYPEWALAFQIAEAQGGSRFFLPFRAVQALRDIVQMQAILRQAAPGVPLENLNMLIEAIRGDVNLARVAPEIAQSIAQAIALSPLLQYGLVAGEIRLPHLVLGRLAFGGGAWWESPRLPHLVLGRVAFGGEAWWESPLAALAAMRGDIAAALQLAQVRRELTGEVPQGGMEAWMRSLGEIFFLRRAVPQEMPPIFEAMLMMGVAPAAAEEVVPLGAWGRALMRMGRMAFEDAQAARRRGMGPLGMALQAEAARMMLQGIQVGMIPIEARRQWGMAQWGVEMAELGVQEVLPRFIGAPEEIWRVQARRLQILRQMEAIEERTLREMQQLGVADIRQLAQVRERILQFHQQELALSIQMQQELFQNRLAVIGARMGALDVGAMLEAIRGGALQALPFRLGGLGALEQQRELWAFYLQNLRALGAGPGDVRFEEAQRQLQALGLERMQRLLGAIQYQPGPWLEMQQMLLGFQRGLLTTVWGMPGDIRMLTLAEMGVRQQMIEQMRAQFEAVLRSGQVRGEDIPALRAAFLRQALPLVMEQLSLLRQLQVGWETRITAAMIGMPGEAAFVTPEFAFRAAVGAGVVSPHFGFRSPQEVIWNMMLFPRFFHSLVGAIGWPGWETPTALAGGRMPPATMMSRVMQSLLGGLQTFLPLRLDVVVHLRDADGRHLGTGRTTATWQNQWHAVAPFVMRGR